MCWLIAANRSRAYGLCRNDPSRNASGRSLSDSRRRCFNRLNDDSLATVLGLLQAAIRAWYCAEPLCASSSAAMRATTQSGNTKSMLFVLGENIRSSCPETNSRIRSAFVASEKLSDPQGLLFRQNWRNPKKSSCLRRLTTVIARMRKAAVISALNKGRASFCFRSVRTG